MLLQEQFEEINYLLDYFPGLGGVRVVNCYRLLGDISLEVERYDERAVVLAAVFIFANFGHFGIERIAFFGGVLTPKSVTNWLYVHELEKPNE